MLRMTTLVSTEKLRLQGACSQKNHRKKRRREWETIKFKIKKTSPILPLTNIMTLLELTKILNCLRNAKNLLLWNYRFWRKCRNA